MPLTLVATDGTCCLPESIAPGPYELEISNGVVTMYPLVRAHGDGPTAQLADTPTTQPVTDAVADSSRRARSNASSRQYKGRSWSRVPAGTRMTGPHSIGTVTMGPRGELSNGRTPNRHLVDNGITANAWDVYKLEDGRRVGAAYDMNAWP